MNPRFGCAAACVLLLAWPVASATGDVDAPTPASGPSSFGTPFPGAPEQTPQLRAKLDRAWRDRARDYAPRTRHLNDDGTPRYTNRLFLETSPYLRQHAHNPVNWFPWGDEAFALAAELGRPVLLSVGYSTCHWCHVMEEESFEDEEIARVLNERYIAVKVDREERPDVDSIYMTAVQAMTGRGGWPMTVWLTPEREPFYGGTYFPARTGDRGARIGFLQLLERLRKFHDEQPAEVVARSKELVQAIGRSLAPRPGGLPGHELLEQLAARYKAGFDEQNGGLRGAPKFPSTLPVRLLLRLHRRTGDERTLEVALTSLRKMAGGGMYDHVGGGFHRYSVDARWLVPHFEKMLYDNALLVLAYVEGYQVSGDEDLARVVREILRYVERDMTSPDGAFYSATDADSRNPDGHMEEGRFFTWTTAELTRVLGPELAATVRAYYAVTEGGNFEGRSILHTPRSRAAVADALELTPSELDRRIERAREKLYVARQQRPAPLRDEKILTAWNGLMISAHARAASALSEPRYATRATRAVEFILRDLRKDGRLLRAYKDGRARHNGYLDDYAFLIAGLLDLFEATGELRWLREAIALDMILAQRYEDEARGGFFLTSDDHESLLAREKPGYDGAVPTGNSVHALNLLRLHALTTRDAYRVRAEKTMRGVGQVLARSPTAMSEMFLAVDYMLDRPKEILIVTPERPEQAAPLLDAMRTRFVPNRALVVAVQGDDLQRRQQVIPLLERKTARGGKATAYVCEAGVCKLPTSDPDVFVRQLLRVESLNPYATSEVE